MTSLSFCGLVSFLFLDDLKPELERGKKRGEPVDMSVPYDVELEK